MIATLPREIPVKLEGFEKRKISIRPRGVLDFAPKLLLDGRPVVRKGYGYPISNDSGNEVEFRLKYRLYDPIPDLEFGGRRVVLIPPLRNYENLWICVPFLIFCFYGGLLGGLCGLFAMHVNYIVFRSEHSRLSKFLLSGLLNAFATLIYFGVALMLIHNFGMRTGLGIAAKPQAENEPRLWPILALGMIIGLVAVPTLWFIEKVRRLSQSNGENGSLARQGLTAILMFASLVAVATLLAIACLYFIK